VSTTRPSSRSDDRAYPGRHRRRRGGVAFEPAVSRRALEHHPAKKLVRHMRGPASSLCPGSSISSNSLFIRSPAPLTSWESATLWSQPSIAKSSTSEHSRCPTRARPCRMSFASASKTRCRTQRRCSPVRGTPSSSRIRSRLPRTLPSGWLPRVPPRISASRLLRSSVRDGVGSVLQPLSGLKAGCVLGLYEAAFDGVACEFDAVAHAEFGEDVFAVAFDGLAGEAEVLGDLV
jgi:hypothetical protein